MVRAVIRAVPMGEWMAASPRNRLLALLAGLGLAGLSALPLAAQTEPVLPADPAPEAEVAPEEVPPEVPSPAPPVVPPDELVPPPRLPSSLHAIAPSAIREARAVT